MNHNEQSTAPSSVGGMFTPMVTMGTPTSASSDALISTIFDNAKPGNTPVAVKPKLGKQMEQRDHTSEGSKLKHGNI